MGDYDSIVDELLSAQPKVSNVPDPDNDYADIVDEMLNPVQYEYQDTKETSTITGKPIQTWNPPEDYTSAGLSTYFKTGFVDNPTTKMEIYSKARFPNLPREERLKKYKIRDGEVIFKADDGKYYPETQNSFLSSAKRMIGETGSTAPSMVLGGVGSAVGGAPGAMVGSAVGEGTRKAVGNYVFDEPQTMTGNIVDITVEGLLGGMSELGSKFLVNRLNKMKLKQGGALKYSVERELREGIITPEDHAKAQVIEQLADKYGIKLAPHQLYDKESMTNIWKYLRKHPQTSDTVKQFDDQLSKSVEDAMETTIKDMVGEADTPFTLGSKIKDASTKAIEKAEGNRTAAVSEIYDRAFMVDADETQIAGLISDIDSVIEKTPRSSTQRSILQKIKTSLTTDVEPTDPAIISKLKMEVPDYPMTFTNTKAEIEQLLKNKNLSISQRRAVIGFKKDLNQLLQQGETTHSAFGINKTLNDSILRAKGDSSADILKQIQKRGIEADLKDVSDLSKAGKFAEYKGRTIEPQKLSEELETNLRKIADMESLSEPDLDAMVKALEEKGVPAMMQKSEGQKGFLQRISNDYKRIIGKDIPIAKLDNQKEISQLANRNNEIKEILANVAPGQDAAAAMRAYNSAAFPSETTKPDIDMSRLHQAKIELDDLIDGSSYDAGKVSPSTQKFLNRKLNRIKTQLLNAMDSASPEYKVARDKFAEMSDPVNRLKQSVVGQLSGLKTDSTISKATRKLISSGDMSDPELLKTALRKIVKEDPTLRDKIAGGFIRDTYEGLKVTQEGSIANVAGKMHKHLFGTKKQRDLLRVALSPQQYHNLEDLMTVFQRAAIGQGKESMTMPFAMIQEQLSKSAGGTMAKIGQGAMQPITSVKELIFDKWNDVILNGNQQRLMDALTSSQATRLIREMKPLKPDTQKFLRTLGTVVNILAVNTGRQKINREMWINSSKDDGFIMGQTPASKFTIGPKAAHAGGLENIESQIDKTYGLLKTSENPEEDYLTQQLSAAYAADNQQPQLQNTLAKVKRETGGLEDPYLDPTMAAASGFGAGSKLAYSAGKPILNALGRGAVSGMAAGVGDYPVGAISDVVAKDNPKLAFLASVSVGLASGMTVERLAEKGLLSAVKRIANEYASSPVGKKVLNLIKDVPVGLSIKDVSGLKPARPGVRVEPMVNTNVQINENMDAVRDIRATGKGTSWSDGLSAESKKIFGDFKKNPNKSAIHTNSKTGVSVDFSTSCPKRGCGDGACPYCYVEAGRAADTLFNMKGANKKVGAENDYQGEVAKFPNDMVKRLNADGGLRMFSFGDYRPGIDTANIKALLNDASKKGLYIKAITKQSEFVREFGDHPNLRINISVDNVPRGISKNAPTIKQAKRLQRGRDNIKIRAVALNEAEATMFAENADVDVVTLYHGLSNFDPKGNRHNKLLQIIEKQNPFLVKKIGLEKLQKYTDTWKNFGLTSNIEKTLRRNIRVKYVANQANAGVIKQSADSGWAL